MANCYPTYGVVVLASSLLFAWPADVRGQAASGVSISYSFPQQQLSLNQPVVVTFMARNESSRPIKLDLGQDRKGGYSFTVTQPDGVRLRLSQYSREGISELSILSLQPSQSFSQRLILNEWYDFKIPGRYQLEGRLIEPILFADGTTANRDSGFRDVIEIGPRDVARLETTCKELSEQIEKSTSYGDAAEAALELSYVVDPVAVPYLQRALCAEKLVEPIAVAGLERIANDVAVRVLISHIETGSSDTAVLARAALERIQKRTSNATLREEIERALIATRSPGS